MIVADTNLIIYLSLPDAHTGLARATLKRDPVWAAPMLWRSEFRKVLATAMQKRGLSLAHALDLNARAIELMRGSEYEVPGARVLRLAEDSKCSAYDCEFVVLAQELGVSLVTADRKILRIFPDATVSLRDFGEQ